MRLVLESNECLIKSFIHWWNVNEKQYTMPTLPYLRVVGVLSFQLLHNPKLNDELNPFVKT